MKFNEELGIMAEVASLYYEQGYSQQEIADKLYFSRSKVSRLISKAIHSKVVEIKINYPIERVKHLETELKNRFNLDEVIVIKDYSSSYSILLKRLGNAAANYLETIIEDNQSIGVSWGETLFNMIESLHEDYRKNAHVVQLMGVENHGGNIAYDATELVRRLVEKYKGTYSQFYSPLVVENALVRKSLMNEPMIYNVIKEAKAVDYVITSVGELCYGKNRAWENHLKKEDYQKLSKEGAVGTLLAHFIRIDGSLVNKDLDEKIIGIKLSDLKKISNVILIAGGTNKKYGLLGALQGRYINTLIIDDKLAKELLKLI